MAKTIDNEKWLKNLFNKSDIPYLILMERSEPSIDKHLYGKACFVKQNWFDKYPSNFKTPNDRLRHLQQDLQKRTHMKNKHQKYINDLNKDIDFIKKACVIVNHNIDSKEYAKARLWKWFNRKDNRFAIPRPYEQKDVDKLKKRISK